MFIFFFFNVKMRIGVWDEEGGKKIWFNIEENFVSF